MAVQPITGEEVIGTPGQCLDSRELRYLVDIADGKTNPELAQSINVRQDELPFVEASIRHKLGARTKPHMVARAFILGILQPRALTTFGVGALVLTGFLYYQHHHLPDANSPAMKYDDMAGGSGGPAVQDPRYIELLSRRHQRH